MNNYLKYTWFIVIFVFLVVAAGGIVRMTQSGMGCPDWPKCFGMWIPPTSADQLPADFEKYLSKQDIDHTFNVYHTWIEYINRLLGALLGVWILIHVIWTVRIRKQLPNSVLVTSLLMLVSVAFTGWLGKVVVDNNLSVVKVTIHMLAALVLAILPLYIIRKLQVSTLIPGNYPRGLMWGLLFICLIQLYLGTGVREQIDIVSKSFGYLERESWIEEVGLNLGVHRSFSWLLLVLSAFLAYKSGFARLEVIILSLVISLVIMGVIFVYLSFPAFVQPLHLLGSMVLITVVATSLIQVNKHKL
jgi:cytochrome c oxidase assembly protein subunit 15